MGNTISIEFNCTRCGRDIGHESHALIDGKIVCVTCHAVGAPPPLTLADISTATKLLRDAETRVNSAAQREAMAFEVLRTAFAHPDFNLEIIRDEGSRCGFTRDVVAVVDDLFVALDRNVKPASTEAIDAALQQAADEHAVKKPSPAR